MVSLNMVNLNMVYLNMVNLNMVNLNIVNLNMVNLNMVNLNMVYLNMVNLNMVNLIMVNFNMVNLNMVSLNMANLIGINLHRVILHLVNINWANLKQVSLNISDKSKAGPSLFSHWSSQLKTCPAPLFYEKFIPTPLNYLFASLPFDSLEMLAPSIGNYINQVQQVFQQLICASLHAKNRYLHIHIPKSYFITNTKVI